MKLFKNKKGITLVELLAVLVILGIIAAIAVPTVSTLINNTQARANVESANSLVSAARLYSLENNNATNASITQLLPYISNEDLVISGNNGLDNDLVRITFGAGTGTISGLEVNGSGDTDFRAWALTDELVVTTGSSSTGINWESNNFVRRP